jgi:hypothetical protein
MHEFVENTFLGALNDFNTARVDGKFPASGSFISAQPYPWFVFLIKVGTLNSALTVQLQQDTGVTQTASIKNCTGAVVSIGATDDDELFYIEVEVRAAMDIANSFTHLTLDVSGAGGGDDYLDMMYFGCHGKTRPITQASTTSGVVVAG